MGNLCSANEITYDDLLREQLCRIVQQYEKLELICGYIGIFKMVAASSLRTNNGDPSTPSHNANNSLYPGSSSPNKNTYNKYRDGYNNNDTNNGQSNNHIGNDVDMVEDVINNGGHSNNNNYNNNNSTNFNYLVPDKTMTTNRSDDNIYDEKVEHDLDKLNGNLDIDNMSTMNDSNGGGGNHHKNNSSTRSNMKLKEKKEIQIVVDLDYSQFYQWKIDQVLKTNPNISDQELRDNYGLIKSASSNNIFQSTMISNNPLIQVFTKDDDNKYENDEKQRLLLQYEQTQNGQRGGQQNGQQSQQQNGGLNGNGQQNVLLNDVLHNNDIKNIDIKNMLKNNDIKSSLQSLGDTTDQLCEILKKAKILHKMRDGLTKKIIHIRGNKQTIFSYYLISNKFIIISYAQSKSQYLGLLEWIKIQSKLEKLEITLKDIDILLQQEGKN